MSTTTLLDKLERRFGRYAVPNVTAYLLMGQVLTYVLIVIRPDFVVAISLVPELVLEGEVWRLVTFALVPALKHPFFMFIVWYLFFLMGTALEHYWGAFR